MAQSVSNEALWEKLVEVDNKLDQLFEAQKVSTLSDEQVVSKPDFQKEKDEIVAEIQEQIYKLGIHSDINFGTVNQNLKLLDERIQKILSTAIRIRKQQKEIVELQKTDEAYFNFRFFKVKKSSLVIVILGLLVFILTIFCMKQQNDYALLMDWYYKQSIEIREMLKEADSLLNTSDKRRK